MTPSSRAGYKIQGRSASRTDRGANFKTTEDKLFQIKEFYAPAKLFRMGGVQWPSHRTGASLVVSSFIECIGGARTKVSLTVQEIESCMIFAQSCFIMQ